MTISIGQHIGVANTAQTDKRLTGLFFPRSASLDLSTHICTQHKPLWASPGPSGPLCASLCLSEALWASFGLFGPLWASVGLSERQLEPQGGPLARQTKHTICTKVQVLVLMSMGPIKLSKRIPPRCQRIFLPRAQSPQPWLHPT